MAKTLLQILPKLQARLCLLGENIRLARLRRRLSTTQLAERAGISRPTLHKVERGDPTVTLGAYANVLFCLGLDQGLDHLAQDDELGRRLQDAELSVGLRAPRKFKARA